MIGAQSSVRFLLESICLGIDKQTINLTTFSILILSSRLESASEIFGFHIEFFWVMTLCSVVVAYQHFRHPCFLL